MVVSELSTRDPDAGVRDLVSSVCFSPRWCHIFLSVVEEAQGHGGGGSQGHGSGGAQGHRAALEQGCSNDDGLHHSWSWQQRQHGNLNPRTTASTVRRSALVKTPPVHPAGNASGPPP